jgi:hypothetical protein
MISRQGYGKAKTSTAHKLASLVFPLLKNGTEYASRVMENEARLQLGKDLRRAAAKAGRLGVKAGLPDSETFNMMVAEKVKITLKNIRLQAEAVSQVKDSGRQSLASGRGGPGEPPRPQRLKPPRMWEGGSPLAKRGLHASSLDGTGAAVSLADESPSCGPASPKTQTQ